MAQRLAMGVILAAAGVSAACADPPLTGLYRGRPVTYSLAHGKPVFEGDILLDHVTALPRAGGRPAPSVGVAYAQYLWPKNAQGVAEIPYTVTSAATSLNAALSTFNTTFAGVIQFVMRGSQTDYVNFDFDTGNLSGQCESYVGHVGGEQSVGGSAACSLGTLLHEMGHVVGLYHEMSRPDRNNFITVNFGNVIKGSEDNFNQLGDNYQDLGLFDYASVMMYIPYAFSRNGGPVLDTIPPGMPLSNLVGYTPTDIDGVKRLYGAAPVQVTVASNPPGLAVLVDGSSVTAPHSFSWKLNSKHTLAVPAGAQTLTANGVTTSYIYGRWNDSTAASHSIKITPGINTLAQPNTSPAVTVYTANFVQLSPVTTSVAQVGAGSIAVSPTPQSYTGTTGQFLVSRQPVTLTATPAGAYNFVYWAGPNLPLSVNPKQDYVPDGAAAYNVTANFSTQPITTITTVPGGFYFTVDGYYYKGPQSFTSDLFYGWGPGSMHVVTGFSPNLPYSVNTQYLFDSWSDHGALSHTITLPSGASTLTGNFTAQYVPIAYAAPGCAANVTFTPASATGFYNAGTKLTVTAAPAGSGLVFNGWTGDIAGKKQSAKLTVTDEELGVANYNITSAPFAVTSLTPDLFVSGSSGGTVKIKGNGFAPGSAVFVNNNYRAATYVSAKEIDVALTTSDLTSAGAFPIGVSNYPASGDCGNYAALSFFVSNP